VVRVANEIEDFILPGIDDDGSLDRIHNTPLMSWRPVIVRITVLFFFNILTMDHTFFIPQRITLK
jgi:hypothetical protein